MTSPEILRPASTPTSISASSNTLLLNFRATLEARWQEFDRATMKEAEETAAREAGFFSGFVDTRGRRDKDAEFLKAKQMFDDAKAMLSQVQNDNDMKASAPILLKVEETLKTLTIYLASIKPEEKAKSHNIILALTTADLASFKAELTGKDIDKQEAVRADAAEKAIPRAAIIAGAGAAATIPFMSNAEAAEIKSEVTSGIKQALGPWGMIFQGVKDQPSKEVATQIKDLAKEYAEKKWNEDPFEKLISMIKLYFLRWQIKRSGIDLSKDMTPDELKLTGLTTQGSQVSIPEQNNTEVLDKQKKTYTIVTGVIGELVGSEYEDITKIFPLTAAKGIKYAELLEFKKGNNIPGLRKSLGVANDVSDKSVGEFLKILTDVDSPFYSLVTGSYEKNTKKKLSEATVFDILANVGTDIKLLKALKSIDLTNYAESSAAIAQSMFKTDEKGEVSGELVEKARGLGFSSNFIKAIFTTRKTPYFDTTSLETIAKNPSFTDRDRDMLKKLGSFGVEYMKLLIDDPRSSLGNGEVIRRIYHEKRIKLGSIFMAYIMTDGMTNLDNMDTMQKIGSYTSFLLIGGDDAEGAGAIGGSILNISNLMKLTEGTSVFDKIPDDVQKLLGGMFSTDVLLKKAKEMGIGTYEHLKGFASKSPGFATFLVILLMFFPWISQNRNLASFFRKK